MHEAINTIWIIRERLRTTQNQQKSYAYVRRSDLEFHIYVMVNLKISTIKSVMMFGKKGKLGTRFVGVYEILRQVAKVAMN